RLLMTEPNVLLLDEPTNDLDIETLTSLEDVLDGWVGTLLVVSHDRYLLERMCDRQVALLGDGAVRDLPGGVEEYLRLRHDARLRRVDEKSGSAPAGAAEPSARAVVDPARQREARKEMARVERALAKLSTEQDRVHAAMVEKATDHHAMAELDVRTRELDAQREKLEGAWLQAAESAD
ncbi:MAG: ABC transporter ATP-binding protein, partial [Micrococcales bacterium]|nr:ABC transporter ATP-binding protein [Micrococcales bacterium]